MSDDIINALLATLASDPDNETIRAHVGRLLLDAGRPGEADDLLADGLRRTPASVTLLAVAVEAADRTGRTEQAEGYRTLLAALGGPPSATPPPPAPDPSATPPPPAPDDAVPGPPLHPEPEETVEPPPPPQPLAMTGDLQGDVPDTADDLLARWENTPGMEEPEIGALSTPSTRLADVGGMDAVKDRLELSFLGPLRDPSMQAAFGKSLRGGLMLWGPPGCGKTFMARAVAGELGAQFYEVGLADVLDMWVGSSERNLRSIFDVARNHRPCVLFFDEIDALGMKRSQLRGGGAAMRGVVNQLLSELDGVSSDNEGIFVLAATNHPWDVDPALLRPGRLDRSLLVLPPDAKARAAIVTHHLRNRPVEGLDAAKVAAETEGLTGADLALLCEQVTEDALAASMRAGNVQAITTKALLKTAKKIRPSVSGWMDTARNHATYSNHDGTYDELIAYLRGRR
ncbi:MAG: ATP-binding protein [Actinomycetota bacterium]